MKKLICIICMIQGFLYVQAQDLDDIKKMLLLKQYVKAKEAMDKFLSNENNGKSAPVWYYKAYLYNVLSRDSSKPTTQNKMLNDEAYKAIKKYRELDSQSPLTAEENNTTIFNIYYGYYDLGLLAFGNKNYEESFGNFKNALDVHDFIFTNNLQGPNAIKFSAHDTDIVWNLAILANQLKKESDALVYYKKIADANLSDEKYIEAYQQLVAEYKNAKNAVLFNEYLSKGKKFYPKEPYWEAVDIEFQTAGLEGEPLFKKYEELTAVYPNSYIVFYNYGVDLNKYVYSDATKTGDLVQYKKRIPELFVKAISLNSTAEANMLLANFYYNNYYDLSDEARNIKGSKPDDVKKRNELNEEAKKNINLSLPIATEAVRLFSVTKDMKSAAKANYKLALEILVTGYKIIGNTQKAAEYEKQKAEIK